MMSRAKCVESKAASGENAAVSADRNYAAPLAFSQLAHLAELRLTGEPYRGRSIRMMSSAMRVRGRIDIDVLTVCIEDIVERHDALRTRIRLVGGVLAQEVLPFVKVKLEVLEIDAGTAARRSEEIERAASQMVLQPIELHRDSLFAFRVLRFGDEDSVVMIALDHVICDGMSVNIILRDLILSYTQRSLGCTPSLPEISTQFVTYAQQQRAAESSLSSLHETYWNERLAGCPRLEFPGRSCDVGNRDVGWGAVPIRISASLKHGLSEWCRSQGTTLVMGMFSAYAFVVLRSCNASDGVLRYQSSGRGNRTVENTVGFFAAPLYMRIELLRNDNFVDLLRRITKEYCRAHEHTDHFLYMAAQRIQPAFARNPVFNWSPRGSNLLIPEVEGTSKILRWEVVNISEPARTVLATDSEPVLRLCDCGAEIVGDVFFPHARVSASTMEALASDLVCFIDFAIRQPARLIATAPLNASNDRRPEQ